MTEVKQFLNGRVSLHEGDCLAILPTLPENSVDSACIDPPYHLNSIVERFGADDAAPAKSHGATGVYLRSSAGFMGRVWDGGDIAFRPETWAEVLRVLKPGAHLLAFGAPKNAHRLFCAIEDAGFEIRDTIMWIFGTGFPKSHDVSKDIDRAFGAEREVVGTRKLTGKARVLKGGNYDGGYEGKVLTTDYTLTAPATDAARQWEGWGTALKPAYEPICLARKPLSEPSIAANVLRWGTGAINIDGCRVETDETLNGGAYTGSQRHDGTENWGFRNGGLQAAGYKQPAGRWPANAIHDGSDEVVDAFPETESTPPGNIKPSPSTVNAYGDYRERSLVGHTDSGSAARFFASFNGRDGEPSAERRYTDETGFAMMPGQRREAVSADRIFYTSKADSDDRLGSKHPTVKPLDLMQYLVRLITPKGGTVLDCFAGTGSTGEAAWREGMNAVLIEREPEYIADIERRMSLVLAGPDERANASIKAKLKGKPVDHGPLWAGMEGETHG